MRLKHTIPRCSVWAALAGLFAGISVPAGTVNWRYDSSGRLISAATDGQGSASYYYDAAGHMIQRVFSAQADADGDGLTTAAEIALGTNPDKADTDGDGSDDGSEAAAGTNPLSAASRFVITSVVKTAGGVVEINIASVTGRRYTLQSGTALGAWANEDEAAAVDVPGTGAVITLRDLNPVPGRKFYRVMVTP